MAPRRIGVVGLGAMSAGIAQVAIEAGFDVVGREMTGELGDAAAARIGHFLTRKVEQGPPRLVATRNAGLYGRKSGRGFYAYELASE